MVGRLACGGARAAVLGLPCPCKIHAMFFGQGKRLANMDAWCAVVRYTPCFQAVLCGGVRLVCWCLPVWENSKAYGC